MTVPLFLASRDLLGADQFTLDGDEGRHAATVRRLRAGERLDVGDGEGGVAECRVVAVRRDALDVEVMRRRQVPPPQPRLIVVQALIKGERAERAIESMTEVGVDVVVPWQAARCVVRWEGARAAKGAARWQAAAREAAKQARRPWLPEFRALASTPEVAGLVREASRAVVLHESAEVPLAGEPLPASGTIVLVVGPEGGLAPDEMEHLTSAGATPRHLGPTVLRAATAGTIGATLALAASGRMGSTG